MRGASEPTNLQPTDRWPSPKRRIASLRSVKRRSGTTTSVVAEAYNAARDWKDNAELSRWLTDHFSHQVPTIASKAMDAEYLRTHIGGNWHRLYDGGHSLAGSWNAVHEALPDLSALDQIGTWANEYWKDFITTRGMPIVTLDSADEASEYFKHLDSVNVAQFLAASLSASQSIVTGMIRPSLRRQLRQTNVAALSMPMSLPRLLA